ncbi:exo-beta-N-acetylmuramidase NamZ family protein [Desulfobacterium sp. N47]
MATVFSGLENFIKSPPSYIQGKRLGLLCNPASVNRNFVHARQLINEKFPGKLSALYSPQHGFFSEKQDNMIESENIIDNTTGVQVFSLYGKTRIPSKEMFEPIDILLIDLQDAGTRVYTFIYTMSYCLEAAKKFGKKVVILDRPNPIGGVAVEGNCLSLEYISFVGRYPIPMRHGLTIGELALLFNKHYAIDCDLEVIPMKGWRRKMFFSDTSLPWIPPSPNLPTPVSAIVYPGQVILEGTNISEGRGTTQPFEIFGAPFIECDKIISFLGTNKFSGAILRPIAFEPTSNKWQGELCRGFQIHVTDQDKYKPYYSTVKILQAVFQCYSNHFAWKLPPYEYEFEKYPVDLITGNAAIRAAIENNDDIEEIEKSWRDEIEQFLDISRKYHIYSL